MHPYDLTATPWQLRPVERFNYGLYPLDDQGWLEQRLPAHWQQHPALRRHTGRTVYRHRFDAPHETRRRYWLRAEGIFYWSRIYLNGYDLGQHEGYFIPQEHEVTTLLREQNTLIIEVDCPEERRKSGKRMLTGVFSHWDAMDPTLNPGGIWLPVVLEHSGPVRLSHVHLQTEQIAADRAVIAWQADLDALAALEVELRWTIAPANFAGEHHALRMTQRLRGGAERLRGRFTLPQPQLWWTHDLGQPNLYHVTLEIYCLGTLSDTRTVRFGVRTFELRNFIAYLNGVRLLIKGNNYPPTDARIACVTPEMVRRDLELARGCHLNLLRIHAHVAHPALYAAADEQGILLWQDFPMQWTYRRTVARHAPRQVAAMLRLLGNHPSVAVWCMHNEPIFITDTADERIITGLRVYFSVFVWSWNRDVLDRRLARLARWLDATHPVISNSGEYAVPFWHRGNDTHFYFGWYIIYGRLQGFDVVARRFPRNIRFVTEFGAQSFPNKESCLRFMPERLQAIDWKRLQQRHSFQPNVMRHWYNWQGNRSLDALIEQTQRYQSELNRYYIDRLRLRKYQPTGGIVPFMFVDSNPAVQWSVIDYWRVPKRSYWALRDAFSPQYAFTLIHAPQFRLGDQVRLPLYVVNDAHHGVRYSLRAVVTSPEGRRVTEYSHTGELAADCPAQQVGEIVFAAERRGYYELRITLHSDGQQLVNTYRMRVGRRPLPRNNVRRLVQALSAALAMLRLSSSAMRRGASGMPKNAASIITALAPACKQARARRASAMPPSATRGTATCARV
ncbi:glycosyl hydrolase 2 galactose-binding domain-containing protein [Kallotenue papyrolyticum]|uniref:glycoside hydrolase family 2 protein n=1 Tax=Kallotenue papyrolyticum TaxID=1325125 RepID=UPI00047867E2